MNYNYVEEKVDTFMIDKLESKYPGVKGKISKASRHSKRMAIASILGNREIFELIKKTLEQQKSDKYLTYFDELVVLFRKYVEVADVEKKTFGEVMTPITLVEDMLDTLPSEVWGNPNLKWLDPCAGVGTFPSIVVQRLMKGLENVIPNPEKRYGHIIENMIYVCELQDKNLFVFNCVFDLGDNNATNSYCGSFLDENFDKHMSDVWGVEKFDIVIGNPPYNTGTSGGNGSRDLWDKFVFKGYDLMIDGGFLLYVHPSKWRSPENKIFDLFKKNNLIYLEIHSKQDGKKVFGATTRYDFYLLQKSNYGGNTKIIDELGNEININICEWNWLPNYNFDLIKTILNGDEKCEVIYSRTIYGNDKNWMSVEKNELNYLPCVYGMYKDGTHSYKYSSVDKGHFGISKVIVSGGEVPYPYNDNEGKFGIMNNAFALKINSNEEGEEIKKAMNSKKFSQILKATKWSNFQINYKMFKSFRKDFYKQFLND